MGEERGRVMVGKGGVLWVGKGRCYGGVRVTGGKWGRVRGRLMVGKAEGLLWVEWEGYGEKRERVLGGKRGRVMGRKRWRA